MTFEEMYGEISMLKGDINRMCVTDNRDGLFIEYESAKKRLERIFQYNLSRIDGGNCSE